MRDLAFLGFFCGPLGLGLALRQSLARVGERRLAKIAFLGGVLAFLVELAMSAILITHAIYFHIAGALLGKLAFDRWLHRPARAYLASGGRFASNAYLLGFALLYGACVFGAVAIVSVLVD